MYKYWFEYIADKQNGEIWHMVDAETNLPSPEYSKIHAWKTSLHSFEHCFLGYVISSYHHNQPVTLYYAFTEKEPISSRNINPYFLRGHIKEQKKGNVIALDNNERGRNVVEITFDYIY